MFKVQTRIRICLIIGILIFLALNITLILKNSSANLMDPNKIIEVFVVPHSHCDPGWKLTWEQYYESRVKHILRSVITSLIGDERRTFAWADVSFLALWSVEQFFTLTVFSPILTRSGEAQNPNFAGWQTKATICSLALCLMETAPTFHLEGGAPAPRPTATLGHCARCSELEGA